MLPFYVCNNAVYIDIYNYSITIHLSRKNYPKLIYFEKNLIKTLVTME